MPSWSRGLSLDEAGVGFSRGNGCTSLGLVLLSLRGWVVAVVVWKTKTQGSNLADNMSHGLGLTGTGSERFFIVQIVL